MMPGDPGATGGGRGFRPSAARMRKAHGAPQGVPDSGLTGPIDIPDPLQDNDSDGNTRRERFRAAVSGTVRALPRVVRLSWHASPPTTVLLGVVTVIAGLLPTATAYAAKLLLDSVVEAIGIHTEGKPDLATLSIPPFGFELHTDSTGKIVGLAVLQFVIFTMTALTTSATSIAQGLLQEKMVLDIRHRVMAHASRMHLSFFEDSTSYDLLRQADREAPIRPMSMLTSGLGLIKTAITFGSMVTLLIWVSPLLAIVALLAPIPLFISQSRYGARAFRLSMMASPIRRRMDYLSTLVTMDRNVKETKLFGLGDYLVDRFARLGTVYYERHRTLTRKRHLAATAWSMVTTAAGSGIALYIALEAVAGRLTLGDLALYTGAATAVQASVQGLFSGFSGLYENNLYLDTLYRFLAREPEVLAPENPRPMPADPKGHIEFDDVTFTYPGADEPALDGVSFEIRPGETIAVVGRNGAGKSTLFKLLCRLYDPTAGRILLDGNDIRDYDPDELRRSMSAMFQDYVTYQGTAAENIGLGDLPSIGDRARIEVGARRSGAAERIERLPRGYDSPLGRWFDGGVDLSGGEWQKVAMARAFVRDAPILILDEPTSALDARAEYELFVRLTELARGRTTLYISHRFSTVRRAERILLLDNGKLMENGTHEELMRLDGDYADLFNLQAEAYA